MTFYQALHEAAVAATGARHLLFANVAVTFLLGVGVGWIIAMRLAIRHFDRTFRFRGGR